MTALSPPVDRSRGDRRSGIALVGGMLALMWVSEVIDLAPGVDLDRFGIAPRDADGIAGIAFAPFLHANLAHLASNTVPFVLMGLLIALGGAMRVALVTAIVAVVGGLGTWLLGAEGTLHLGASILVFGYAGYLLSRGFFDRRALHLVVALLVAIVWGGVLLVGLVPQPGISWLGHAFGAVGGVVAGRMLAERRSFG